jgi:hypothetical protein
MSKPSQVVASLPAAVQGALVQLGDHLSTARLRRAESLRDWAVRLNVSVPTLMRMEKGDPKVGMGVYATALWLAGFEDGLRHIASPSQDAQALAQELRVLKRSKRAVHGQ